MTNKLTQAVGAVAVLLISAVTANAAEALSGPNGMTLYVFDKDKAGVSSCYATCATKWPPYLAAKGEKAKAGWTMIKRKGGKEQWAYDGKPLYYYAGDKKKGDSTGDGLGGVWHVASD